MSLLPRVTALMSAYNEADVIGSVIASLTQQGIHVYLIDDGSTDGTVAEAEARATDNLLTVERRPLSTRFEWEAILRRKEELARLIDTDWFIHHDADEFRESPWPDLSLREGIGRVEESGFTAIDFEVLQFVAMDDAFQPGADPRRSLTMYRPADDWDRVQIKCWKKPADPRSQVDIASSGGHDVRFEGRTVFPVKFLLRHYPLRGLTHGRQKVLVDRLPRYVPAERSKGWHVQYDAYLDERGDSTASRQFDPIASRLCLLASTNEPDAAASSQRLSVELSLAGQIAQLRQRVGEHECRIRDLEVERADRSTADVAARRFYEETRQAAAEELSRQGLALKRAVDELRAVRASLSWRLTAPLRWMGQPVTISAPRAPDSSSEAQVVRSPAVPLDRLSPVSRQWGLDRGTPIDRVYIERFLEAHRADISGRVLEVKDDGYTRRFGSAVTDSEVLDVDASNPAATVVGDLTHLVHPVEPCDCFILTQTLHIIYDVHVAVRGAAKLLKPGGVLLCTLPAVSRVNDENGGVTSGDYWRFAQAAVRGLFREGEAWSEVTVETFGNVGVCAAFLYGFAAEELDPAAFAFDDPWFPLIHAVRARRAG